MSDTTEQPGRYQRTFEGLIGSMIVIVLVVVGFAVYRGLFRDAEEIGRPEPIDYLPLVRDLQGADLEPVYPSTLPDGWSVTEIGMSGGDRPLVRTNLYTSDDKFVGIRQVDDDVADLLDTHVDSSVQQGTTLVGVGTVAATWEAWSDDGGDHAYSTSLPDGDTVLVYGNVSESVLQELIVVLTIAPVGAS